MQPGDYNALLEIPGGMRLVARSAEPVARGAGSAPPSAIQPPSGIRPLQLTSEVSFQICKFEHFQDPVPGFNFLNFSRERCTLKKNKIVI